MRLSFRTLQRGNAGRDALRRKEDAKRPERHADAERRTITAWSMGTIVGNPSIRPSALPSSGAGSGGACRSRRLRCKPGTLS
ncbi:DUF1534 domain-containing protein [Pseudomonas syringae]|nr:DUF1534 domain-containing protein [Pseudomonas syringae]MCF5488440.1 DUF1534 domain-containing protein [Pseudomonas syringae]MCF5505383.1 DUF1534 domain-containing protein [Pseudomonas syringae]MCF5525462.1 DUF1534 domain-containing protein [Pseudomonas syringae]MCF5573333.1 DUF1534 domain-containing protein [Pseudomonas syringae]